MLTRTKTDALLVGACYQWTIGGPATVREIADCVAEHTPATISPQHTWFLLHRLYAAALIVYTPGRIGTWRPTPRGVARAKQLIKTRQVRVRADVAVVLGQLTMEAENAARTDG